MNQTLIKAILLLIAFTLSCHTLLFSQRDFERHEFSFHAGYGVMFHHPPTLTLSTHSYQRTLAQGVSWDGQYNFALSNVLSLEESTPDFLPKEVIRKGRTIYGFISLVLKSECVMLTPNIGKSV